MPRQAEKEDPDPKHGQDRSRTRRPNDAKGITSTSGFTCTHAPSPTRWHRVCSQELPLLEAGSPGMGLTLHGAEHHLAFHNQKFIPGVW